MKNEDKILLELEEMYPIINENQELLNASTLVKKFFVLPQTAKKIADKYNFKILLLKLIQLRPIINGEQTFLSAQVVRSTFVGISDDMAQMLANAYNSKIILLKLKEMSPIMDNGNQILMNPKDVEETFNIPKELAEMATNEYNYEIKLSRLKSAYPINKDVEFDISTSTISKELNVSMDEANKLSDGYKFEEKLYQLKEMFPIINGSQTFISVIIIINTFPNISKKTALRLADEYNSEIILKNIQELNWDVNSLGTAKIEELFNVPTRIALKVKEKGSAGISFGR